MRHAKGDVGAAEIRLEMQQAMQRHAAVFRSTDSLSDGVASMDKIAAKMGHIGVKDQSLIWNTDLVESLELENLMVRRSSPSGPPTSARNRAAPTRMRTGPSATTRTG